MAEVRPPQIGVQVFRRSDLRQLPTLPDFTSPVNFMYEFASSVINIWEKKLLSKTDQERMLTAPDKEASFLVLYDTDLADFASKEQDVEKIFESDLSRLKENLTRSLDDKGKMVNYLFLIYDGWNLKIVLKEKFLKQVKPNEPFACSLLPYSQTKAMVQAKFSGFSRTKLDSTASYFWPSRLIETAVSFLAKESSIDSSIIETAVDKAYFSVKQEMAEKLPGFLKGFVKIEIDTANVKALMSRAKRAGFIAGGNLNPEDLKKLSVSKEGEIAEENLSEFLEILELSFLIEKFKKNQSEIFLEQGLQHFLSDKVFEKAWAVGTGVAKILSFFFGKINSHFNIRLIFFAKENNLAIEEIENLLLPI